MGQLTYINASPKQRRFAVIPYCPSSLSVHYSFSVLQLLFFWSLCLLWFFGFSLCSYTFTSPIKPQCASIQKELYSHIILQCITNEIFVSFFIFSLSSQPLSFAFFLFYYFRVGNVVFLSISILLSNNYFVSYISCCSLLSDTRGWEVCRESLWAS